MTWKDILKQNLGYAQDRGESVRFKDIVDMRRELVSVVDVQKTYMEQILMRYKQETNQRDDLTWDMIWGSEGPYQDFIRWVKKTKKQRENIDGLKYGELTVEDANRKGIY